MTTVKEYVDNGCRAHPSCLNCPEPVCRYERITDKAINRYQRNKKMLILWNKHKSISRVAELLDMKQNTVSRTLTRLGVSRPRKQKGVKHETY